MNNWFTKLFNMIGGRKRTVIEGSHFVPHVRDTPPSARVNVDHRMARDLYRNMDNGYALSAHLLRPVIDGTLSFIGKPVLKSTDAALASKLKELEGQVDARQIMRVATREGTAFVWVQWEGGKPKFVVPRPETVTVVQDPLSKEVTGYIIDDTFSHIDIDGNEYQTTVTVRITEGKVVKETKSTDPSVKTGVVSHRNPLGFLPIVIFANDSEPWEVRGHSDITPIEPTLKVYHDLFYEAVHAQRRNSPKLKIITNSVRKFIENNFGVGMYDQVQAGRELNLDDREVFVLEKPPVGEGDDMDFVTAAKTTGDATALLEMAFMNTVEGSQTPEVVFGANMGASLSSVEEQRPAFIRRVEARQEQFGKSFKRLFDMALAVMAHAEYGEASYDYTLSWQKPDFSTDKEKADTMNVTITALIKARNNSLMGDREIHRTLAGKTYVDVESDYDTHMEEVAETQERRLKEMEDYNAAQNDLMTDRYTNLEYEPKKKEDSDE